MEKSLTMKIEGYENCEAKFILPNGKTFLNGTSIETKDYATRDYEPKDKIKIDMGSTKGMRYSYFDLPDGTKIEIRIWSKQIGFHPDAKTMVFELADGKYFEVETIDELPQSNSHDSDDSDDSHDLDK